MTERPICTKTVVAAIDFGTTYSGYAFSFLGKPLEIHTNPNWVAGSERLISLKTSTCVLLKPNKEFHSFGFQAENKYNDLAEDDEHYGWYFFRRFKMSLYNTQGLTLDTLIEDISGKKMPALTVTAHAIRFMKSHFLETLNTRSNDDFLEKDVLYVLTVPAIWDETAKQFMRAASREAGVPNEQLKIALEPEAASIWCQIETDQTSYLSDTDAKYMVVDLGGGTADITVHQKLSDGSLKEIHNASGGAWGGTEVDKAYFDMLTAIVGNEVMNEFQTNHLEDFFDMCRDFETKKRTITSDSDGKITFKVPASLRENAESKCGTMAGQIDRSRYQGMMTCSSDKLRVQKKTVKGLFQKPLQLLVDHVRKIFQESSQQDVRAILLVGGFAECDLVKEAFRENFNDKKIIIPSEAGLAVLKGAVRFGHMPNLISSRISRFVFGRNAWPDFDESIHDVGKVYLFGEKKVCMNVFYRMVDIGEEIPLGNAVSEEISVVHVGQNNACVGVYSSTDPNVTYVTEPSCRLIGELDFDLPESSILGDKDYKVIYEFGDTEIKVVVTIYKTNERYEKYFSFQ